MSTWLASLDQILCCQVRSQTFLESWTLIDIVSYLVIVGYWHVCRSCNRGCFCIVVHTFIFPWDILTCQLMATRWWASHSWQAGVSVQHGKNFTVAPCTAGNPTLRFDDNPCDYFTTGKVKATTLPSRCLCWLPSKCSTHWMHALSEDGSLLTMPLLAMTISFSLHFLILYVPFLATINFWHRALILVWMSGFLFLWCRYLWYW